MAKKLRKLWATSYAANDGVKVRHESLAAAERYIDAEAANWAGRGDWDKKNHHVINVWVDERDGFGWQLWFDVDLATRNAS